MLQRRRDIGVLQWRLKNFEYKLQQALYGISPNERHTVFDKAEAIWLVKIVFITDFTI